MNILPYVAAASLLLASASAQAPPTGVRLVYELPIDALQRTLQASPDLDLEQLLARTVETIGLRLRGQAKVTRDNAAGFTVDVPAATAEQLASLRRRIEAAGTLELRMLASPDYQADGCTIDLDAERTRLQQWLVAGGRRKLLADPTAIGSYAAANPGQLRWAVRRLRPRRAEPGLWQYSFTQHRGLREATVTVYSDDDWNKGQVPAAGAGKEPFLLELVALNLHAGGFTQDDLDTTATGLTNGHRGNLAVAYRMIDDRKQDYSDWSARFVGKCSAIIVNGEVLSAPRFMGRIPGVGVIDGDFTESEASNLMASLRSGALPMAPKLVRQEALPPAQKAKK